MSFLKKQYLTYRIKFQLYKSINWMKTIYINLKFFPIKDALKFPIIIFGQCSFTSLSGKFIINTPIKTGIITFGHRFEIFKKSAKSAELFMQGTWEVNGPIQIGYDFKIYIEKNAVLETGYMCTIANNSKVVCSNKITMGNHVKIGDESQLIDTNFHDLYDLSINKKVSKKGEIFMESYISTGSRVTIMKNTKIPNYSLIASNSVCNKDLTKYGQNNLFGGVPVKFIKNGLIRNWKEEEKDLEDYLTIKL